MQVRFGFLVAGWSMLAMACAHSTEPGESEDGLLRQYRPLAGGRSATAARPAVHTPASSNSDSEEVTVAPTITVAAVDRNQPVPAPATPAAAPTTVESQPSTPATEPYLAGTDTPDEVAVETDDPGFSTLGVQVRGARRCAVRVGEKGLGRAPFANKRVPAGKHRITVRCPNKRMYSQVLLFAPGGSQELFLRKTDFKRENHRELARN